MSRTRLSLALLASLALALWSVPPVAAAPVAYPVIQPSISKMEGMGAGCGGTALGVWIPNVGHCSWKGSSAATADGVNVIQCTGVATGRMIIDPGPLALASITAMQNLPGPVANMKVTVAGTQGGTFIATTVGVACTTDDGTKWPALDGTLICWDRMFTGPVDLSWFVATTAAADNSIGVQAWLSSGYTQLSCGGTYYVDAVTLSTASTSIVSSQGCMFKAKIGATANATVLTVSGTGDTLKGVSVDQTNSSGTAFGIKITANNVSIQGCNVNAAVNVGVYVAASVTRPNVDCTFTNGQTGAWGLEDSGSSFARYSLYGSGMANRLFVSEGMTAATVTAQCHNCQAEDAFIQDTTYSTFNNLISDGYASGDDCVVVYGSSSYNTFNGVSVYDCYGIALHFASLNAHGSPSFNVVNGYTCYKSGEDCLAFNSNGTSLHPAFNQVRGLMAYDPGQKTINTFSAVEFIGDANDHVFGNIVIDDAKAKYAINEVVDPISAAAPSSNLFEGTAQTGATGVAIWDSSLSRFLPTQYKNGLTYVIADADKTWDGATDNWNQVWSGTLTANRTETLSKTDIASGTCVGVSNQTSGGFSVLVANWGGSGLASLSSGQNGAFQFDGSNFNPVGTCH